MPAIAATLLALSLSATSSVAQTETPDALRFTENKGQWGREARFLAHTPGLDVWVTDSGVTYDFYRTKSESPLRPQRFLDPAIPQTLRAGHVVQVGFEGALATAQANGVGRQPGVSHFLRRKNTARYVSSYSAAEVKGLYPGVDMRMYADAVTGGPRFDIVLAPGANLAWVKMRYQGAQRLRVDRKGRVTFDTSVGKVVERGLYAYEIGADGSRQEVKVTPAIVSGTVTYRAPARDLSKTLVIDPLVYSTLLGFSEADRITDVAVNSTGQNILGGMSGSVEYPITPGAYDDWEQEFDAIVTKMSPDGSAIVWSTFLGGAGVDTVHSVVLDSIQRPVVAGHTTSADFPTVNAYDPIGKGGPDELDVFVAKLTVDGSNLVFSTYFASSGRDTSYGLAIDASDRIFISGTVAGADLPIKSAYQGRYGGGTGDGFVASFAADGMTLRFSTYLGGSLDDLIGDVALDSAGRVAVVGTTLSTNYPTRYALQRALAGSADGVITVLDPTGKNMLFSTFYGGDGAEELLSVGFDGTGRVIAMGGTNSAAIDTTTSFGTRKSSNALVVGVNPNWTRSFATVIGGIRCYFGLGLGADERITVTGVDFGCDVAATAGAFQYVSAGGSSEGIAVRLSKTGNVINYLTRLGGSGYDELYDGAFGPTGLWHAVGSTGSKDFPTTPVAFDKTAGGDGDGFLAQIGFGPGKVIIDPVSFTYGAANTNVTLRINTPVAGSTTINLSGGGGILQLPPTATIAGGSTSVTISVPLSYGATDVGKVIRFTAKGNGSSAQRVFVVPAP